VHFITLDPKSDAHNNLLGVVNLFGFQTHVVVLAEEYTGAWPEAHAHLFNLKDWTAYAWKAGEAAPFVPPSKGGTLC
jgi:hypothetical protein